MRTITGYHRPATLDEALGLLARGDVSSTVVAGGTVVNASEFGEPIEVVDVQAICSNTIAANDSRISVGSMARVQNMVDSDSVPSLLRELARREGPNTLRNAATVGGAVATADPESELVAGLLAHEAAVEIARMGATTTVPVAELLADRSLLAGGIITSISFASGGTSASARTGRTPEDTSIVAAVGRRAGGTTFLALTGVAPTPILIAPDEIGSLEPPGDFRGSCEYRRELAKTLAKRVLDEIGGAA